MTTAYIAISRSPSLILPQALQVRPSAQSAADLLLYYSMACDFIHNDHAIEEKAFFPATETTAAAPGLMDTNCKQHRKLGLASESFRKYAHETARAAYDVEALQGVDQELAM